MMAILLLNFRQKRLMTSPPALQLDAKAWRILNALQADGRAPLKQLAQEAGLSIPATAERLKRLQEAGVITGVHAQLDAYAAGYGVPGQHGRHRHGGRPRRCGCSGRPRTCGPSAARRRRTGLPQAVRLHGGEAGVAEHAALGQEVAEVAARQLGADSTSCSFAHRLDALAHAATSASHIGRAAPAWSARAPRSGRHARAG
jgi:DNA-binding Lrp family transcriptional regulator